jgi:hypothetical protein
VWKEQEIPNPYVECECEFYYSHTLRAFEDLG